MEYQLALPSDLGLSPADFVAAWSAPAEYRAIDQPDGSHILVVTIDEQ
jgi:hypothetical protein